MKKIEVNGTFVPTPIKLKWKAGKYDAKNADIVQNEPGNLITEPIITPSFYSKENKLRVELKWESEPVFESKLEEKNATTGSMHYGEIHPEGFFSRGFEDGRVSQLAELPTKLIDLKKIKTDSLRAKVSDVIKVKDKVGDVEIKNYAILSYSWNAAPWGKFRKDNKSIDSLLHSGAKKSLGKAIKACKEAVDVDYLWMDCLCIDQTNKEELTQELAEVRKYYSNAKVTLISIQADLMGIQTSAQNGILERLGSGNESLENVFSAASDIIWGAIVKSDWFKRSWTFQEGLLSRQTIFMFDDYLIDGRLLAMTWSIKQKPDESLSTLTTEGGLDDFLRRYSKKIATPLGWAYYHDGYSSKDTVYLGLFQALEAIKNRKRYIAVDGIYSIIGLLHYEVKPNYKVELWGGAKHDYSEEEVVKSLVEVMENAAKKGYGEPLSWYGKSNSLTGYCWLPEILVGGENTERNGSMVIEGIVEDVECEPNSMSFSQEGMKISGSKYDIISTENIIGGDNDKLCSRKILVRVKDNSKWVNLQGTRETLKKIMIRSNGKSDIMLLVPNRNQWRSNLPVALLVDQPGEKTYHRIDLVRILEGSGHLNNQEEELIIGMNSSSDGLEKKENQELSQINHYIEIPPKK